jgi:hypothetical protein
LLLFCVILLGGRWKGGTSADCMTHNARRTTHNQTHKGMRVKLTQRTIIPRHLTRRAAPLKRDATDPTDIAFIVLIVVCVSCVPAPLSDSAPVFDVDFHRLVCVCAVCDCAWLMKSMYVGALCEEDGLGLFGVVYASWVFKFVVYNLNLDPLINIQVALGSRALIPYCCS